MRNALIVLAVIALVVIVAGAVNHDVAFNVDFVVGDVQGVSLFWVAAVVAAVAFAGGAVAMWLTHAAGAGTRRKLETELRQTYERLRAAEAEVAAQKTVPATVTHLAPADGATAGEPAAGEEATAVAGPPATPAGEATAVAGKPDEEATALKKTGSASGDGAETIVGAAASDAADAADAADDAAADPEQTAVTIAGDAGAAPDDEDGPSGDTPA